MADYLEAPPLILAHRGGVALPANAGIENTVQAIANAVELGIRYIETDARASVDGVAFAFHDEHLGRVAPDSGFGERPFGSLTAAEIRSVRLPGGEHLATIADLLETFPATKFNIDVKTMPVIVPTVRAIEEADARERVLIASFSHRRLSIARRLLPTVATSTSPREIGALWLGRGRTRGVARRNGAVCLQVPEYYRRRRLVTPGFLAAAHGEGLQVHIWTVDRADDVNRLLDLGVDGIITDRPDVVREVLELRGQWR